MSNDEDRLETLDGRNGFASSFPAARSEVWTEEAQVRRRTAKFKKSHALYGILFLTLWCVFWSLRQMG